MKNMKTPERLKRKTKPLGLTKTFTKDRKYRNHKRYVHPDLL